MTGCYTPYQGTNYGYTPDGWLYGTKITDITPEQYNAEKSEESKAKIFPYSGKLEVVQADNGLWYYKSIPANSITEDPMFQNIVFPTFDKETGKITDTKG